MTQYKTLHKQRDQILVLSLQSVFGTFFGYVEPERSIFSSLRCIVESEHTVKDLDKGRGGDRSENLCRGRRLLRRSWSRPSLIKLDKEERVFEGPSIDDSLHKIDEGHNHEADEEEGEEGPQVVPGNTDSIAEAAEPTLVASVGCVTGGVWGRSVIQRLLR